MVGSKFSNLIFDIQIPRLQKTDMFGNGSLCFRVHLHGPKTCFYLLFNFVFRRVGNSDNDTSTKAQWGMPSAFEGDLLLFV
jgi:hypothetical protein